MLRLRRNDESLTMKEGGSLPLRIKLRLSLVIFLFILNLLHSILTHTERIWITADPLTFIELYNTQAKTD